jgi:hypothetical protein
MRVVGAEAGAAGVGAAAAFEGADRADVVGFARSAGLAFRGVVRVAVAGMDFFGVMFLFMFGFVCVVACM